MPKLKEQDIFKIINVLKKLYPDAGCALNYETTFQLLVAVMLSAQTTDVSVNKVTPVLFANYPDAASIASIDQKELEEILRRIGMYRTKAKHLRAMSDILVKQYGGEVPSDYDKLISLPGVGRKTANVVLSVAFQEERIAVDTHVFRLSNRIGITAEKNVLKTEMALMEAIPKKYWINTHHLLIWHGRQICSARKPKCDKCKIYEWCKRNGVQ